jgi:hypothetical protein
MSNETQLPTKRRVEVTVGVPDILDGVEGQKSTEMPHPSECYFLTFVDAADPDGSFNTLSAQTSCLCTLKGAIACWLQGGTEEEVKEALTGGHDEDHDAGEEWKQS